MNNNTIKRLADNPHYAMNDKELEALAKMLHDEAEAAKKEELSKELETAPVRKVNKNRVSKTVPSLTKTPTLQEDNTDVDERG